MDLLAAALQRLVASAFAVNVHADVLGQFEGEIFPLGHGRTVGTEPGHHDALAGDVDAVVIVQRFLSVEIAVQLALQTLLDEDVVAVDVGRNVGISPVGEGPVEERVGHLVERPNVPGSTWRMGRWLEVVHDVALVRPSVGRQVAAVEIGPHVEHDGLAVVDHSTVGGGAAAGHGAAHEHVLAESESGGHSVRIAVPFGPQQDQLGGWLQEMSQSSAAVVFNTLRLDGILLSIPRLTDGNLINVNIRQGRGLQLTKT